MRWTPEKIKAVCQLGRDPSNWVPAGPEEIEQARRIADDMAGRAFGLAAHTIGAVALAVVHNLGELKREANRELKRLLSRQKRNGITPEPSRNGTGTPSTPEESPSNTLSTRGPP